MVEVGDFWTVEEIAIYLRLPQSTVYKLTQDKVLPGFKVGKHWRFRREAVLEWIQKQENPSLSNVNQFEISSTYSHQSIRSEE